MAEPAVIEQQLQHLDDTDTYATAWSDALLRLQQQKSSCWGGRGQGGRGLARRTHQPANVSVPNVRLEYIGATAVLLEQAQLKLRLQQQQQSQPPQIGSYGGNAVYALVGPNGSGKSSLLRRMHAGKIPGFPPHVSTLYISQDNDDDDSDEEHVLDWLIQRYRVHVSDTVQVAGKARMEDLECQMDLAVDGTMTKATTNEDDEDDDPDAVERRMQELAEAMSTLETELEAVSTGSVEKQAREALEFMGIQETIFSTRMTKLTPGQRRKVSLAFALLACCAAPCDLLLLDEPSNSLDIPGLLQLRQLIDTVTSSSSSTNNNNCTTVMLVSHDIDFINDVATNVIEIINCDLDYYAGNYADYRVQRQQLDRRQARHEATLDKKADRMRKTLDNLKKLPTPRRKGGAKKKSKQITSHKKKMERVLPGCDTNNRHITSGAYSSIHAELLVSGARSSHHHHKQQRDSGEPDKAVQFCFRKCKNQWNEPLISALEVGHGFDVKLKTAEQEAEPAVEEFIIQKKEGFLFDCVDLSVDEGGTYCILGDTASGKSTLLQILAKKLNPTEGKVLHALNVKVALLDHVQRGRVPLKEDGSGSTSTSTTTALSYVSTKFPTLTEQDIRGELTAFGLSPTQATADLRFLSGGEQCRLRMAEAMLGQPEVLLLDQPTANLDVESVEALVYGLRQWNGTVVMVSHDAHFLRSLEAQCFVLLPSEGKLRRVNGGVDAYLRSFAVAK